MRSWTCCILILLASCATEKRPEGIIPPKKMQPIIWEYLRTDIYLREFAAADSGKDLCTLGIQMRQQIFNKYKVSREDYYRSYRYYTQNPGEMRDIIDSLLAMKQLQQNKAATDREKRSRQFQQLKNLKSLSE